MRTPVFEEFDPASDCDCPGCALWHRFLPFSRTRTVGPPAVHRVLAVAAASAASAALGAVAAAPAHAAPHGPARPGVPAGDEPGTPQGGKTPLHGHGRGQTGTPGGPKTPRTTRTEIVNRAKKWLDAKVPYSMNAYWSDGYRQDCSGFVSMAWSLPGNEWTGSLGQYGERVTKDTVRPGDMLLFHNTKDPQKGSHVVIFGGWTDYTHTYYTAYEQTPPHTRRQGTPYAYWSHSDKYVAYRYKGLASEAAATKPAGSGGKLITAGGQPGTGATPYPGAAYFGPGANNKYVAQLGRILVSRGAAAYYATGPGPRWSDADRRATEAFQRAQGWTGAAVDGRPGPRTWELLATGAGRDIAAGAHPAKIPAYPGRGMFRPGADNVYVAQLGRQLVKKGFGKYFTTGPGPRWGEPDRRAVEAFQRAQGWRGGAADGYPGPETWRRIFS
ncbi:peptidoglycan-binding protein [Streptomyces sp. NPDC002265]|uniref:peptidoglycan-binding protein n=1 Tax=Streptomyces sp. NPDC002265 TaxID=3154415 RepID=UPI00332FEC48